jgi:hypothetical protein
MPHYKSKPNLLFPSQPVGFEPGQKEGFGMKYLPVILCFAVSLVIGSSEALTDECQDYRDKGYADQNSSALAPFDEGALLDELPIYEIFRATSGYYCNYPNNHPTIYGHGGDAVTVVGAGYEETFALGEIEEAFAAYMRLLERQEYLE